MSNLTGTDLTLLREVYVFLARITGARFNLDDSSTYGELTADDMATALDLQRRYFNFLAHRSIGEKIADVNKGETLEQAVARKGNTV